MYICELPKYIQVLLKRELIKMGIDGDSLEDAMNSKLYDLDYLFEEVWNDDKK